MLKKSLIVFSICLIFAAGFITGCIQKNTPAKKVSAGNSAVLPTELSQPNTVEGTGTIEVAFSPGGGAAEAVIKTINKAKTSINVQAYIFTNSQIARSLLNAKKRGIDVKVILDKSQRTDKYSSAKFFADNSIPVKIDNDFQIAHSKIMIIDDQTVITGSFNFTKSAEEKNAENLLIIHGNKELTALYLKNWLWRWDAAQNYNS
ncbi:phospholipase D family nuclease [Pectinatus haikarae]|uniref:phospholipase D n=1 Tax=Pectinatus haikarae TaxID=349096 RepID=A0ABT9Y9D9_9FIRM|nr:phospholipase D family protein [Pectinatus haikarae]MDQ0204455.1 phosphatidylserine/phosphatidylglycerophosphate/cardiolipin synthase-like enzyme [Pectinatus haikarae]